MVAGGSGWKGNRWFLTGQEAAGSNPTKCFVPPYLTTPLKHIPTDPTMSQKYALQPQLTVSFKLMKLPLKTLPEAQRTKGIDSLT